MSLLPPPGERGRERLQDTILGQWLVYTTNLVQRVAELEAEVANSREVLAGEAVVPMRLVGRGVGDLGEGGGAASCGAGEAGAGGGGLEALGGRVLVFPQDRYVLANCGAGLYERLNEELALRERAGEARERDAARALRGGWVRGGEGAGARRPPPPRRRPGPSPVAFLDVPSRVYRVKGCETLFIIPAFGMREETEGTRKVEAKALVQTVVRPHEYALGGRDAWERGVERRGREAEVKGRAAFKRARELVEEVQGLKRRLAEREAELERERLRVKGLRGLERDLAIKEVAVREEMEGLRDARLERALAEAEGGDGTRGFFEEEEEDVEEERLGETQESFLRKLPHRSAGVGKAQHAAEVESGTEEEG